MRLIEKLQLLLKLLSLAFFSSLVSSSRALFSVTLMHQYTVTTIVPVKYSAKGTRKVAACVSSPFFVSLLVAALVPVSHFNRQINKHTREDEEEEEAQEERVLAKEGEEEGEKK